MDYLPFKGGTNTLYEGWDFIHGISAFSLGAESPVRTFFVRVSRTVTPPEPLPKSPGAEEPRDNPRTLSFFRLNSTCL